jgi:hypothetical protein
MENEGIFPPFFTFARVGFGWSASLHCLFNPRKHLSVFIVLVAGSEPYGEEKIS